MSKSFKAGIKTKGDRDWSYNALRFDTAEAAGAYALDLSLRWTAVESFEVHESEDEPNRFTQEARP